MYSLSHACPDGQSASLRQAMATHALPSLALPVVGSHTWWAGQSLFCVHDAWDDGPGAGGAHAVKSSKAKGIVIDFMASVRQ